MKGWEEAAAVLQEAAHQSEGPAPLQPRSSVPLGLRGATVKYRPNNPNRQESKQVAMPFCQIDTAHIFASARWCVRNSEDRFSVPE